MPTKASEKLIKIGDLVTLCQFSYSGVTRHTHIDSLDLSIRGDIQCPDNPVHPDDDDEGNNKGFSSVADVLLQAMLTGCRECHNDEHSKTR